MDPRAKRLYWQISALLLAAHFADWPWGMPLVIALNAGQCLHVLAWGRSLRAFDVQVRLAYLGLLLLGHAPGLGLLHLVQFAGVNAMLVADYCLLARLLALLPWNRRVPLNPALVRWVLLSPPAPGAIHERLPGSQAPPQAAR